MFGNSNMQKTKTAVHTLMEFKTLKQCNYNVKTTFVSMSSICLMKTFALLLPSLMSCLRNNFFIKSKK